MILVRIVAAVLFLLGALAAFGWLGAQDPARALGFVAFGLVAWVVSTFPVPVVPPSR